MKKTISLFWTSQMENDIKESIDNYWSNYLTDSLISNYDNINKEYQIAVANYKKGHSKFKYGLLIFLGLPLSLITIIPFYWAYKKFKYLKTNKDMLEGVIEEKGNEKLLIHRKILSGFNINELEDISLNKIGYKNMGPITQNLVDEIKSLSLFEYNDSRTNPYRTSWGIYEDNKIVISSSKQEWVTYMEEYSGSIQVPYTYYDSQGRPMTGYKTIVAYYSHPAQEINYENTYYTFMESCSSLEFKFNKPLRWFFSRKSDKSKAAFENSKFDNLADWKYNNDAQMRMIFTPLGQENYVNEIAHIGDKKIPERYRFCKDKSFFYNLDSFNSSEEASNIVANWTYKFINDYSIDLYDYKKYVDDAILLSTYSKFESMIYLWMIPIFKSEDHSSIIKRYNDSFKANKKIENSFVPYHIFNKIFRHKSVVADTDTFHKLMNVEELKSSGNKIFVGDFVGISFNKVEKIKYVYTQGHSVPVKYIDYIKVKGKSKLVYSFVGNKNVNKVKEILHDCNFPIKFSNGFISSVYDEKISDSNLNKFSEILKEINKIDAE